MILKQTQRYVITSVRGVTLVNDPHVTLLRSAFGFHRAIAAGRVPRWESAVCRSSGGETIFLGRWMVSGLWVRPRIRPSFSKTRAETAVMRESGDFGERPAD